MVTTLYDLADQVLSSKKFFYQVSLRSQTLAVTCAGMDMVSALYWKKSKQGNS